MATDVARVSFDRARQYTGVVPQQGRVTLEAEENEERTILVEERRLELLDVVGSVGTPDDGYALSSPTGFDLEIGPGTMYVGGNRVELDAPIDYADQPDWLDHEGDPAWLPEPNRDNIPGNEHVVLVLTETDVTAVEDPALREVALGGPDGAARTRLLQRVRRLPTEARDCVKAAEQDAGLWAAEGLVYDPETAALTSGTRLLVGFDPPQGPPVPCEPSAQGGFLGAENQAIRVQVVAVNPEHPDQFDLVWGWDDASMLYRVGADASTNPILTLERSPVDDFHRPRAGQAVQVLRSAAALAAGDGVVEGYVASLNGPVAALTAPYDPDRKTIRFPQPLPGEVTDKTQTPQLYLRVWEKLLAGVRVGDTITLTGTGLTVTLSLDGAVTAPHPGDFWIIGVRPATPGAVLPARLLRTPQPPDGPRMWACPLAVIAWDPFEVLDDCRVSFDPLTEQEHGCCCAITVHARDAARLQDLVDKAAAHRVAHDRTHRVTVCLRPGQYLLRRPLLLEHEHSHLHLEGCGEGVVFAAQPGLERRFVQGLITMVYADNVRISGIEFEMPQVPAAAAVRPQREELKRFRREVAAVYRDLAISIAIRPVHCAQLEIDRCLFRFTLGPGTTDPEDDGGRNVFGVGVFAASECWGLQLTHNRFLHDPPREPSPSEGAPQHMLIGLLLAPSLVYRTSTHGPEVSRLPSGSILRTLLERGRITQNEFTGLTVGVVLFSDLGEVRLEDNVLRDCYGGFFLSSLRAQAFAEVAGRYTVAGTLSQHVISGIGASMLAAAADPVLVVVSVIGRSYPLPAEFLASSLDRASALRAGERAKKADQIAWMQRFVDEATAPFVEPGGEQPQGFAFPVPPSVADAPPHVVAAERAHVKLSDFERAVAFAPSGHAFRLRVTGNDLECAVGEQGMTGPALMVWDTDDSTDASAMVSDNRMSGRLVGPVALLMRLPFAVVCGNLIRNGLLERSLSLAIVASGEVALTGNLVVGRALVPAGRPFPPPLDTWEPLNTGF